MAVSPRDGPNQARTTRAASPMQESPVSRSAFTLMLAGATGAPGNTFDQDGLVDSDWLDIDVGHAIATPIHKDECPHGCDMSSRGRALKSSVVWTQFDAFGPNSVEDALIDMIDASTDEFDDEENGREIKVTPSDDERYVRMAEGLTYDAPTSWQPPLADKPEIDENPDDEPEAFLASGAPPRTVRMAFGPGEPKKHYSCPGDGTRQRGAKLSARERRRRLTFDRF